MNRGMLSSTRPRRTRGSRRRRSPRKRSSATTRKTSGSSPRFTISTAARSIGAKKGRMQPTGERLHAVEDQHQVSEKEEQVNRAEKDVRPAAGEGNDADHER